MPLWLAVVRVRTFDTAAINNTFAGKLDLSVNPSVAFDVANLKLGDFEISNSGTLEAKQGIGVQI